MRVTRYRAIPGRPPRFSYVVQLKLGDRMLVIESKRRGVSSAIWAAAARRFSETVLDRQP